MPPDEPKYFKKIKLEKNVQRYLRKVKDSSNNLFTDLAPSISNV
jgi:hypothetical protein